jgi:hypothetical protein
VTAQGYTFRWLQAKLRGGSARAGTATQADSRVTSTYMLPVNRPNPHYPARRESCARPAGQVGGHASNWVGRHGLSPPPHARCARAGRVFLEDFPRLPAVSEILGGLGYLQQPVGGHEQKALDPHPSPYVRMREWCQVSSRARMRTRNSCRLPPPIHVSLLHAPSSAVASSTPSPPREVEIYDSAAMRARRGGAMVRA